MGAGRAFYIIRLHQICTPYSAKCNVPSSLATTLAYSVLCSLDIEKALDLVLVSIREEQMYFNLWSIDILSMSA